MNKKKKENRFAQIFVIFLTSFLLWVIFSFNYAIQINPEMSKNASLNNFYTQVGEKDLDMSKFWEVYHLIIKNNYDSEWIQKSELVESSIKWLVEWLWDKHSEYMTLDETQKFQQALSGDFEWIWAVVEKNPLWVMIERLIKWAPAIKAWLRAWDIIIKANETELEWMELFDAVDKIKWPAGTKVILEVLRAGESGILTIEVTRDKIKIPSVESKSFDDGRIGYISINMFGEETSREFEKALEEHKNTDGLIIDLRDNGGGYLQSAVSILSNLVEDDKTLVVTKYKDLFSNINYPSINNGDIYEWKIVVLINENSASASEITAWALKDYKKAIIVWKKSYGKWSVQKPFDLADGSMLKLTIARWYTPNDISIDKEWIHPDIEISFKKEDYTPQPGNEENFEPYDRQLEEAKKVLDLFIEKQAYTLSIDTYNESIDNE